MNVSMMAVLPAGDAGGHSAAAGSKDGGEGFGLAVKTAEEKHGQAAKGAGAAGRRHGQGETKGETAVDGDETAASGASSDETDGVGATSDVLGRILGGSFLSIHNQQPATRTETGQGGGNAADGEAASGELEERIVISTVADLAGAQGDDQPKRVALRVTGMETHFEPHRNAPTLVDAEPANGNAASTAQAATTMLAVDAGARNEAGVKPPFAEILKRLETARSDTVGTSEDAPGGGDARSSDGTEEPAASSSPSRSAAHRQAESRSSDSGTKPWTAPADRAEASRGAAGNASGGQSTGQIINAQLADRIIGAFADQSSTAGEPAAASPSTGGQMLRLTAGGGALKTLSIQLEPQDLGRVDVSMRLVDGRLTVELAASEPSTAATLAGDRHGLRKILEHAGFALDDAAITIVARDPGLASPSPSAGGDAGANRQSPSDGQAFGNSGGNRREGERPSTGGRQGSVPEPRGEETATAGGRRAGSVYL